MSKNWLESLFCWVLFECVFVSGQWILFYFFIRMNEKRTKEGSDNEGGSVWWSCQFCSSFQSAGDLFRLVFAKILFSNVSGGYLREYKTAYAVNVCVHYLKDWHYIEPWMYNVILYWQWTPHILWRKLRDPLSDAFGRNYLKWCR